MVESESNAACLLFEPIKVILLQLPILNPIIVAGTTPPFWSESELRLSSTPQALLVSLAPSARTTSLSTVQKPCRAVTLRQTQVEGQSYACCVVFVSLDSIPEMSITPPLSLIRRL